MHTKESQNSQNRVKRKQILHKKRHRKRRIRTGIVIIIAFLLGYTLGNNPKSIASTESIVEAANETLGKASLQIAQDISAEDNKKVVVSQPQKLSYDEAIVILTGLAGKDSRYADIVSNLEIYPETLLIQLTNNPEMLEFVQNYTKQNSNDSSVISQKELDEKIPLFTQWDERWGYDTYGDNILAVSGCGPTALSMVIVGLTHNEEATPAEVASFSMNNGYYMSGTGTKWSLMSEGAAYYGLNSQKIEINESVMQQSLDKGDFIICSMGPGDFTANGHFIVICGYDNTGFQVNDPFCVYRSRQTWKYGTLKGQIKCMWALEVN